MLKETPYRDLSDRTGSSSFCLNVVSFEIGFGGRIREGKINDRGATITGGIITITVSILLVLCTKKKKKKQYNYKPNYLPGTL
jgi:hypothetical protein